MGAQQVPCINERGQSLEGEIAGVGVAIGAHWLQ